MRKKLDDIDVEYIVYRVTKPIIVGSERYRILNNLARKLSDRYRCIAVRYTPTEDFNGVIIFGSSDLEDEITEGNFKLERVEQGAGLDIPHLKVRCFFLRDPKSETRISRLLSLYIAVPSILSFMFTLRVYNDVRLISVSTISCQALEYLYNTSTGFTLFISVLSKCLSKLMIPFILYFLAI